MNGVFPARAGQGLLHTEANPSEEGIQRDASSTASLPEATKEESPGNCWRERGTLRALPRYPSPSERA